MIDYELKHICDNALKDSITSHFSRDNLLVKLAGAFGPSNAGEAQARMSHTTGGADTPPTGGFRNWGGQMTVGYGGLQPGADMNGVENRTNRMQSAGMHQQQMQMPEPRDNDDNDGGDNGGGFFNTMMGSMIGTGIANFAGSMFNNYMRSQTDPSMLRGQKAMEMTKNIQDQSKKLGIDMPESTMDPATRAKNWQMLPESEQYDVITQMGDIQTDLNDIERDEQDYNEAKKNYDSKSRWNPTQLFDFVRMQWNRAQQIYNKAQLGWNKWQLDAKGRGLE